MAFRIFKRLRELLDVDTTGVADGDALTYDAGSSTWVPGSGGGGGGVTDADYLVGTANAGLSAEIVVGTSPGGELGGTWASPTVDATHSGSSHASVQSAAEATAAAALASHEADTTNIHGITNTAALALTANVQPLDSDLTAIAALTTTSFGRALLTLADQAALLSAAGAAAASHAHAGEDITSGTVADARIASTIARDSEVTSAIAALSTVYQPLDSDLTAIAALTTTSFGRSLLTQADAAATRATLDLEAGTDFPSLTTFNDHSARHEDGGADEISLTGLSGEPADTVNKSLYDANTVLAATSDNTPAAITMGASTILARLAAGNIKAASVAEIITLLQAYTVGGTDVALADGGTGASLVDPNADRIMFWDDSAGAVTWLTAGTNLTITGTTIDASSSGGGSSFAVAQTAHGLAVQDVVRNDGNNVYVKAQANSVLSAEACGIVSAVADANNFTITTGGYVSGLSGLTAETTYFLSGATAGLLTATEPTTLGHVSRPLLYAVSTTAGVFALMRGIVIADGSPKPAGKIFLSAAGMWPSTTNGAAANTRVDTGTNDVDVFVLDFADGATKLLAQATIAMPSDWNGGTVTAKFYWMANSTSTNPVLWGCQGRSFGDAETIDQAFGTEQTVTDAGAGTANQVLISTDTSAITLAGTPAGGELVQFRVSRDPASGSDTLAATARLLGVQITYSRT